MLAAAHAKSRGAASGPLHAREVLPGDVLAKVLLWGLVRDLARWTAVSRGFRAAAGEAWTAAARRLGGAASGLPTDPVRRGEAARAAVLAAVKQRWAKRQAKCLSDWPKRRDGRVDYRKLCDALKLVFEIEIGSKKLPLVSAFKHFDESISFRVSTGTFAASTSDTLRLFAASGPVSKVMVETPPVKEWRMMGSTNADELCLRVSPDGRALAVCFADGSIGCFVVNVAGLQLLRAFAGPPRPPRADDLDSLRGLRDYALALSIRDSGRAHVEHCWYNVDAAPPEPGTVADAAWVGRGAAPERWANLLALRPREGAPRWRLPRCAFPVRTQAFAQVFEGVTVLDAAIYDEAMRPLWAESRFVRASAPARAGGREAAAHSFLAQQVREVDFGAAFGDSWSAGHVDSAAGVTVHAHEGEGGAELAVVAFHLAQPFLERWFGRVGAPL